MVFNSRSKICFPLIFASFFLLNGRITAQENSPIEIEAAPLEIDPSEVDIDLTPATPAPSQAAPVVVATLTTPEKLAWVWDEPLSDHDNPEQERFFRLTFELDSDPNTAIVGNAVLRITADDSYELYVNEEAIERDESKDDNWEAIRAIPLTGKLRSGRNVIGIKVVNQNEGPAGVIALMKVTTLNSPDYSFVVKTGENTKVCSGAVDADWNSTTFDDSTWESATIVGEASSKPWKLIKKDLNLERDTLLRHLVAETTTRALGVIDSDSSLALVELAHLATDYGSINLLPPVTETLDPSADPKKSLSEHAIEIVSANLRHQTFSRRTAAWNAFSLLVASTSKEKDSARLTSLLESALIQFQGCTHSDIMFQSVVLNCIGTLIESDAEAFEATKAKMAELANSVKSKSNDLASKRKELGGRQKELKEYAATVTMFEGQIADLNSSITELGAPDPASEEMTQKMELQAKLKIVQLQLNSTKSISGPLGKLITKLQFDEANLSQELQALESEVNKQLAKLKASSQLIVNRTELIHRFGHATQKYMQSEIGIQAANKLMVTAKSNFLVYQGITSFATASKFIGDNGSASGTVSLIDGVGGPTAATDRSTATSLQFVGERPGVSNTSAFDTSLRPGARVFRSEVTAGAESAVERAPGGTGADQ